MQLLFTLVVSLAAVTAEDRANLADGTLLTGKVVGVHRGGFLMMQDGERRFVEWGRLGRPGLTTAQGLVVVLSNGDRFTAHISGFDAGHLLVKTAFFPDVRLPVSALTPRPAPAPEPVAPPGSEEVDAAVEEAILEEKDWHGSLALSGSLRTGNTDSALVQLKGKVDRQWTADRMKLYLSSAYGETEGKATATNILGGAKWDHFYKKNASGYVRVEAEHDEIKNLDLRSLGGLGGGLNLWKGEKDQTLDVEGGVDALYKSFAGEDGETDLAGRLAVVYKTELFEDWFFVEDLEILFPVPELGEFVFRSKSLLKTALSDSWFLQNGLELEWQGDVPEDTRALDLKLFVGLEYRF